MPKSWLIVDGHLILSARVLLSKRCFRPNVQAALSCLLAQQRKHTGSEPFDWGTVATKAYIRVVDRLIPQTDMDLDSLDDEEQMSASKERRNLTDVFLEKRRGVSSLKLRTLFKVKTLIVASLRTSREGRPTSRSRRTSTFGVDRMMLVRRSSASVSHEFFTRRPQSSPSHFLHCHSIFHTRKTSSELSRRT